MPEPQVPRATRWLTRFEWLAYALLAATLTLGIATRFYGSLRLQTLYSAVWSEASGFEHWVSQGRGPWSAPLDDVFIHFDFARSIARGYPFQWSEGNGYSSGGTSVLYPFVLAIGYWSGLRELDLMEWAALVACVCTFGFLLGARRLARELHPLAGLLLPFGLLLVGTLDWSLFSGMEVALFLALWALAFVTYDDIALHANHDLPRELRVRSALFGCVNALVAATRPEGITAVLVLTLAALLATRRRTLQERAWLLALATLPAFSVLTLQTLANRVFTGETTAAGALVKLELHHPYLDLRQVLDSWLFFIKYQALRVTQYHFADKPAYGWLAWLLGLAALALPKTRRAACILWASAVAWVLLVAMNGQVRWQNERYTMPAVAWLLAAASLGTGALLQRALELRHKLRGPLLALLTLSAVFLFVKHQAPRFREQLWFFGRASRNIYDQHVQAALLLRDHLNPQPRRVLVGDAGAIPYVSDLPALDIIGLGGYHGLPFARATRQHVGGAVELIERMAPEERPDVLAIYPGWWGDLPLWFGHPIAAVPVRGNVVCGGAAKVLYRADWSSLAESARPFSVRAGERLLDVLDQADLVNEREHAYRIDGAPGFVGMELLANPSNQRPLWDAGRRVPPPASEQFTLKGDSSARKVRLIVRAAPTEKANIEVRFDGKAVGKLALEPHGGWLEAELGGLELAQPSVQVRLGPADRERVIYHVFLVAEP